jgi:uncharacterized phiE125 gp8 family phage protein
MALASLADIKAFLSIVHLDDDDLLTRLVSSASTYFEQQTGRTISATDYVEIQDGNGGRTIVPSNYPLISVVTSGIVINGTVIAVSTAYGVAGYYVAGNVIKLRDTWVSAGQGNVSISYRAGYAVTPEDVRQAVLEMTALMYREKDRVGTQSKTLGGEPVSYYYAPPARVVATIEAYRRAL